MNQGPPGLGGPFATIASMTTSSTDDFHGELAAHLDAMGAARASATGAYRVERVLKESPSEVTQLVWLRAEGGSELGPFVRKEIAAGSGLGGAYRELFEAQRSGRHFRHLPRLFDVRDEAGRVGGELDGDGRDKGGRLAVVMEYIPGATLAEVIRQASPEQRPQLAARLMPVICDAVSELHEAFSAPLIHRDLTPANIVCPEGDPTSPVLIDLGISRSWREGATSDTTHFGTRAYAPPEQFGFGQTDVRSDVYALGMLALFCLLGRDPVPADRERGFAVPGVPEAWRSAIARACALDPAARFASARELGAALRAAGERLERGRETRGGTPHPDARDARMGAPRPDARADAPRPMRPDSRAKAAPTRGSAFVTFRRSALALFSRIPEWVGLIWDAALFACVSVLLVGCAFAVIEPNEADRLLPRWFLVFQYGAFVPALVLPYVYALSDRRWLRRRIPALGRVSVLRETAVCLGIMMGAVVVFAIVTWASGVTLVSTR